MQFDKTCCKCFENATSKRVIGKHRGKYEILADQVAGRMLVSNINLTHCISFFLIYAKIITTKPIIDCFCKDT